LTGATFTPTPTPSTTPSITPTATITPSPTATVIATATATPSGPPPTVSISGPVDGTRITAPTSVTGSVFSQTLASWQLAYRLAGGSTFTALESGTTNVDNATLTLFDPTLLLNGIYELQLTGTDLSGRSTSATLNVVVDGNMKVGNFTLSFVDIEVPMVGIP